LEGAAVLTLLKGVTGQQQPATASDDIKRFVDLKATKRNESVAGFQGTIYELTYVDRAGRSHTEEMVLTTNKQIAELTRSVGRVAAAFQRDAGVDNVGARELLQTLESRGLGLLRYTDKFQLISL